MRPLWFLLQKEFRQIFRDKGFVGRLFIAPAIQLILLPLAANFTAKNVNLAIVDHDHSSYSAKLTNKILSSGYFKLADYTDFNSRAYTLIENDKAVATFVFCLVHGSISTDGQGFLIAAIFRINRHTYAAGNTQGVFQNCERSC